MKTNIKKPHLIGKECAKEKIIGLLFTCVYVLFFLGIIHLLYSYHIKKDVLFLFMYPDWMLLSNSLFSIIGISASILLYKKKNINEIVFIYHFRGFDIYNHIV